MKLPEALYKKHEATLLDVAATWLFEEEYRATLQNVPSPYPLDLAERIDRLALETTAKILCLQLTLDQLQLKAQGLRRTLSQFQMLPDDSLLDFRTGSVSDTYLFTQAQLRRFASAPIKLAQDLWSTGKISAADRAEQLQILPSVGTSFQSPEADALFQKLRRTSELSPELLRLHANLASFDAHISIAFKTFIDTLAAAAAPTELYGKLAWTIGHAFFQDCLQFEAAFRQSFTDVLSKQMLRNCRINMAPDAAYELFLPQVLSQLLEKNVQHHFEISQYSDRPLSDASAVVFSRMHESLYMEAIAELLKFVFLSATCAFRVVGHCAFHDPAEERSASRIREPRMLLVASDGKMPETCRIALRDRDQHLGCVDTFGGFSAMLQRDGNSLKFVQKSIQLPRTTILEMLQTFSHLQMCLQLDKQADQQKLFALAFGTTQTPVQRQLKQRL